MSLDEDRMAALRARFASSLAAQAAELERLLQRGQLDAVRQLAHSLAGRAGMFGFAELGEAARRVDEAEDPALQTRAEALLTGLRDAAQVG